MPSGVKEILRHFANADQCCFRLAFEKSATCLYDDAGDGLALKGERKESQTWRATEVALQDKDKKDLDP